MTKAGTIQAGGRARARIWRGVALTAALSALTSVVAVNAKDHAAGGSGEPDVILTRVSQHVEREEKLEAGEAWLVADPAKPKRLTVIWLATRNAGEVADPSIPLLGYCGIGRSENGGKTWSISRAPYHSDLVPGTVPICGDPAGGVLPDGRIVFTAVQIGSYEWVQSITSADNGATWSTPTEAFGATQTVRAMFAAQGLTDIGAGRQFLAVDSTDPAVPSGVVYVQSQVDVPTTGRMMTVSKDAGATWSTPLTVGNTTLGPMGAAFGKIAGVSDGETGKQFQVSGNYGETWEYHTVAQWAGTGRGYVAADPTTRDRFAVLLTRGSTLEVWITTDAGGNWTQTEAFTVAEQGAGTPEGTGTAFSKPWIAFSPNGTLGVVWRYYYGDGTGDVDAVVSRDGGTTFDDPVRLTASRSSRSPHMSGIGDDCACNIHMSDTTLSTTWGDGTNGRRELWFGSFEYAKKAKKR